VTERTDEIAADLAELKAVQSEAQRLKESLQANDQVD
jgi:cell shape-determining protein MreC